MKRRSFLKLFSGLAAVAMPVKAVASRKLVPEVTDQWTFTDQWTQMSGRKAFNKIQGRPMPGWDGSILLDVRGDNVLRWTAVIHGKKRLVDSFFESTFQEHVKRVYPSVRLTFTNAAVGP